MAELSREEEIIRMIKANFLEDRKLIEHRIRTVCSEMSVILNEMRLGNMDRDNGCNILFDLENMRLHYEAFYDEEEDEEDEEDDYEYEPRPRRKQKKQRVPVNVTPMAYDSFDDDFEDLSEEQKTNLGLIMSVPLQISVEIGRTKKKIKDILEFTQGTIVELVKQAGSQVDIIINGQVIAKGDVVVVNDNFGVRVTEIVKKDELVKITM